MCSHSIVFASDVVVGGISYDVNLSTMEATVVSGDYNFRNITIPGSFDYNGRSFSVVTIGEYAFNKEESKSLSSLKMPQTIKNIESHAFGETNYLKKIIIPKSVEKIRPFNLFCATDSIVFEDGETSIEFVYHKNSKVRFFKTKYIYFGRDVKSIEYGALTWEMSFWGLAGCNTIETIEYGNAVKSPLDLTYDYGDHDIDGMESLKTIILGKGIDSMFEGIDIPSIETIICKSDNPRGFDPSNKFTDSQYMNIKVCIPKGSINNYINIEGWKNFFNIEEQNNSSLPKLETPTIEIAGGKITFGSKTDGVIYHYAIRNDDIKTSISSNNSIKLENTYIVQVYTTKDGYNDSDISQKEIKVSFGGDMNNDGIINVEDIVNIVDVIMQKK